MSKKHFIALADALRALKLDSIDRSGPNMIECAFTDVVDALADFCARQNGNFNRQRWIDYIAGECGPNGGKRP